MEPVYPTTPFGRRTLSLAQITHQMNSDRHSAVAPVNKWQVFRDVKAARPALGLGDRAITVLDALLSFHQQDELAGENLIVFPSNEQIALRASGMPQSTMRRHLAALVACGLILRRDSPNGKRYVRRGREGAPGQAFGFDLGPLVARADEFRALAVIAEEERRQLRDVRSDISILRRDIIKGIAFGCEERVCAPVIGQERMSWVELQIAFDQIVARQKRGASLAELHSIVDELQPLAYAIRTAIEAHAESTNISSNAAHIEQHIHNSNPNPSSDFEPAFQERRAARLEPSIQSTRVAEAFFPLGMVLQACPDLADYGKGGEIASWRDFVAAAAVARGALGVSPSAWEAAQAVMGEKSAAIVIAAILQRGAAIASAGGYLRELTRKAELNEFSVGPMLMALIGARNRGKRYA